MTAVPDPGQVIAVIREAAEREILPRFRNLQAGDITAKNHPSDLVTTADIEAERHLSEALTALRAGSVVVGEEAAEADPGCLRLLAGPAPVWLIDPVDGTGNFVKGDERFAVIVAYCVDGETVAGWIHDPVRDVTVWAVAGGGAWRRENGTDVRLKAASPGPIGRMRGSIGNRTARKLDAKRARSPHQAPAAIVRFRCTGHEYMHLSDGRLDFAQYTRLKPWDHAAGVLIHSEAGGASRMIDHRGRYRPGAGIIPSTLLLAPDDVSWEALYQAFTAADRLIAR